MSCLDIDFSYTKYHLDLTMQLQHKAPNFQISRFNSGRARTPEVSDNKSPKVGGEIWSSASASASASHSEPEDEKIVPKNQSQFVVDKLIPTLPKEFQTLCFDLWFLIVQPVALCSEENAVDVLALLIMNMDFSGNHLDDDAVIEGIFIHITATCPALLNDSM